MPGYLHGKMAILFVDCNRVVGSICVIEKLNYAGEELREKRSCSTNVCVLVPADKIS